MKKLIITCALLGSVSLVASAQTTEVKMAPDAGTKVQPVGQSAARTLTADELKVSAKTASDNTKMLTSKLGLSKEQGDKVYEIEYSYQSRVDRYPANAVPSGLLSNLTSERNIRLRGVFTAEQTEKYTAMSK